MLATTPSKLFQLDPKNLYSEKKYIYIPTDCLLISTLTVTLRQTCEPCPTHTYVEISKLKISQPQAYKETFIVAEEVFDNRLPL